MPQRRRVAAAIVLHGKLGRFDRGVEGEPTRAVHAGVVGALDLAVFCYAGYVRHVLEPSRSAGLDVHFFGHSWSPTIGKALDALFRPRASSHEPEEVKRNHRLCRELEVSLLRVGNGFQGFFTGMDGWGQNSCERTASHLLGISRAVELMRRSERASELEYERVLISRWDMLWQRPLPLTSLPIAPGVFVLPHQCASSGPPDTSALVQHRHRVCGGGGDHWLGAIASGSQITTGAIECGPPSRGCENDLTKSARAVFVLDWWIAARRVTATDGHGWSRMVTDCHGVPLRATDDHGLPWMATDGHGLPRIATDCHGLPLMHLTCPRLCPDRLTQPPSPLSATHPYLAT
jgi:hypothetical protein